jgi:zinc protease
MNTINRKEAPAFKQVNNIEFLDVTKTYLDNGIEVNYINGGSQEIIKIDFIFKAGNLFQNKVLVASSTNSLLKEGTANYSAQEISEGIDNYGAFLEVENAYDTASLTLYTLNKHLDTILPIVKEVILSPQLSEKEFNIYKNNASERFKTSLEKVSFVARSTFMSAIFGENHPYGKSVQLEDYSKLTIDDLTSFYKKKLQLKQL